MARLLVTKNMVVAAAKKFFTGKEEGAALVEYAMLVGLIAIIVIAALLTLQMTISGLYNNLPAL
jgi:Flp pilus assembly pilin Flp